MAQTNIIDRIVGFFSPEAGVRRQMWREASATYRDGVQSRASRPWTGGDTSYQLGTGAQRQGMFSMRDRARAADRDNPIATALLNAEIDNVIADGMTLQVNSQSADFNREAEARFAEWIDAADIRGMLCGSDLQRQYWRMCRRDGDGGIILVSRGGQSRLQLIPGDRIRNPLGKVNTPTLADGVEVDGAGRPIAFYIETLDEFGKRTTTRVLADDFIYLPFNVEPLHVRGTSCFRTIFDMLDILERYVDGVALAAWMATVFGLVFKQQSAAKETRGMPFLTDSKGEDRRAITLENSQVRYVGQEDDVVQVDAKQPMQQTPEFIRAMLRLIGIPFDMPLEIIARDMSTVNFSSARIGLLGFHRACRVRQNTFNVRVMGRIYRWWVSREIKMGSFAATVPVDPWTHEFVPRGWDYTDPIAEVQSDMLQIDMGLKSPQMCAAERGRDWELIQGQLTAAREVSRENEIPLVHSTMTRDEITLEPPAEDAPGQSDGQQQDQQDDEGGMADDADDAAEEAEPDDSEPDDTGPEGA
jgi:lambda family phage portal protein